MVKRITINTPILLSVNFISEIDYCGLIVEFDGYDTTNDQQVVGAYYAQDHYDLAHWLENYTNEDNSDEPVFVLIDEQDILNGHYSLGYF